MSKRLTKLEKRLLNERWKTVYIGSKETNYEVSNYGNVKSLKNNIILSPGTNKKGYLTVVIYINAKPITQRVHSLVARAFIDNPKDLPQINHKDGNKTNNNVWNLEWITNKDNVLHGINMGLIPIPGKGINSPACKNTEEAVHNVCRMLEKGAQQSYIAKTLGVTRAFIIGIKYGGRWSDITSQYNIPKSKSYGDRTLGQVQLIQKLINEGLRNKKDILQEVGLPDTKTNRRYVKYVIMKNG